MVFRLLAKSFTRPNAPATGGGRIAIAARNPAFVGASAASDIVASRPTCAVPVPANSLISVRRFDSDANKKAFEEFRENLSPARRKLFDILNHYRTTNYAQCLPSRFLKDIVAAVDVNKDGVITKDEYLQLLKNIGHEGELSNEELDEIFNEVGVEDDVASERVIPVQVLLDKWKPLLLKVPLRG